jgi:hypothetical protein
MWRPVWFLAGAIALVVIVVAGGFMFLKTESQGIRDVIAALAIRR